jgi:predicted TPR repeat methyltransferase
MLGGGRWEDDAMAGDDDGNGAMSSLRTGSTDSGSVARYYDDWAEDYDATLRGWGYAAPGAIAELMRPHLPTGARVLDVGCGTGLFAEALHGRMAARLDGLDISADSLEIARRRGGYEALIRHDLQVLPLPVETDAYDGAASVGVLTYVADDAALLRDLCRAVRAGGVIAFTQRSDLWESRDGPEMLRALEREGLWTPLETSAPRPYLPANPDFAEEIGAVHVLARVR